MKIEKLPQNDQSNGWSQIIPKRTASARLNGNVACDWLVIGAGFAGLAAARKLALNNPDDKVVLIEAGEVGEGAQGRNSGFAIDLPHNVGSDLNEIAHAKKYRTLVRSGIARLKEHVEAFDIKCDWDEAGKFHGAASDRGIETVLAPTLELLKMLDEPFEWLDADQMKQNLGTAHFKAGIYTPGNVLLNPSALCKGLADSLPENVRLYENSPVVELDTSGPVVACTENGKVSAEKVILTVGAFAPYMGLYRRHTIPLAAHGSLTRPLTQDEQNRLGGRRTWGLTPANAFVGITMRRTSDQRLLIRQNISYDPSLQCSEAKRLQVAREHQTLFDQRFPMLKGVEIEHTWTGFFSVTANGSPGFGQLNDKVFHAVGCNGVGVAKQTIAGELIADKASGLDNPLIQDFEGLGEPSLLPPSPFKDIGIKARFAWEFWRNRMEA